MNTKKRKCQGCKAVFDAELMHKITLETKSRELYLNPNSKILGRSAYLCKNPECIKRALKKKTLKNALRLNDYSKVENILNELLNITV